MRGNGGRFCKLELSPLLKIFRKPLANEHKRFQRLEVDGHKINIDLDTPVAEGETQKQAQASYCVTCPQCHRNNPKNSLYCLYCSFVFNSVAEQVPEASELQPYQIKCGQCGKIGTRNQRNCLYCGYVFDAEGTNAIESDRVISVNLDGTLYRSDDPGVPMDVRELMNDIRRNGYSKEKIDAWLRNRNVNNELKREQIDERIHQLNWSLVFRILQVVIVFGIIFFVFSMRGRVHSR